MAGILSKSQTKGDDFCGMGTSNYIVRSDLGCYMYSSNIHQGLNLEVYSLHPSCQGGDSYLAHECGLFYIIKGNKFRSVKNLSTDLNAEVYDLHPNCQGGDFYLCAHSLFYIIFKSKGVFRQTSNMHTDYNGIEYSLHPSCKDGLYYWGTKHAIYFVKPKDKWGNQFYQTNNIHNPAYGETYSIHPDVMNFLPGGLSETQGPAFGIWEAIKTISNDSETPVNWEMVISRKVGYSKSISSSIEHNWKISASSSLNSGALTEAIAKFQFSLSAEYGGCSVNTENENWEEATEVKETVRLTMQPNTKMYFWQYKLGFGKQDVLFCRDMIFDNEPKPPTTIPLPRANN